MAAEVTAELDRAYREERAKVLATLTRHLGVTSAWPRTPCRMSPVVTINRAVAVAHADGPETALELLAPLEHNERPSRYQPLHAARAELLRRNGDLVGARAAYVQAIALTDNARERAALERRANAIRPRAEQRERI